MTTMPLPRRLLASLLAALALAAAACAGEPTPEDTGFHELADGQASRYETAYIAAVQVPTDGEDGYILIRNNWDQVADMGGWAIRGRNNRRLPIPPSTFVQPNGKLRIHLGPGDSDEDDLYLDMDEGILEWDRLSLVDAADERVSRFEYGR